MKKFDVSEILKKAEQFQVLSFFQDVLDFVVDVKPLLDSINKALDENLKKMPTATQKLNKVSEATEFATTEILDIVDGLFVKKDNILHIIDKLYKDELTSRNYIEDKLLKLQRELKGKVGETIMLELQITIDFIRQEPFHSIPEDAKLLLDSISGFNDDLTSIMMSLQVQDITSQQIAAVNNLLDTIRIRLSKMLNLLSNSEIMHYIDKEEENQNIEKKESRTVAFDPNAIDGIFSKEKRQKDVDNLIEMLAQGKNPDEVQSDLLSEDEINSMFSDNSNKKIESTSIDEPVNQDDIDALFGSNANENNEEVSQDDIDALFGSNANENNEEVSQDDIDALFGK
ncbi:MAG TPA: protein phosphatase CheZ [Candidatus Kapabacteria bacterium]|nr:protein phosphatase CheZ [Candidatus Kapabacteria bacterium]